MARPDTNTRLRTAHLSSRQANVFSLTPNAEARARIAGELGLLKLPRLSFTGSIIADLNDTWTLKAKLTAQVVQPSVVTLEPVSADIGEDVRRVFSPHLSTPEGEEAEMPDDEVEPLGQYIDLEALMTEELSLALPLYPRLPGEKLEDAPAPQDEDETRRPFAGLADLLQKKAD